MVFGAGGFVGGWICEELSLRGEIEQLACVRKWASAVRLARRGVDVQRADLEDVDDLDAIVSGADVVVNAAMPPPSREPDLVMALFTACVRAGVRRFIQFSSAAVYGDRTGEVDETVTLKPVDDYGRGKAAMEARLVEAAATSATQLVIFRPSIIYGPFSEAWTVRFVERITKRGWRDLGRAGEGTCNLVHADDVAKAVAAAAIADIDTGPQVLNINGPDVVTWNEYIERLGDALNMRERVTPNLVVFRGMVLLAAAMRVAGQLTSLRSLYRRSTGPTRAVMSNARSATKLYPSLGEMGLLARKVHYSSAKATRVLGVTPSIPLGLGLQQSVAWCRIHGVV